MLRVLTAIIERVTKRIIWIKEDAPVFIYRGMYCLPDSRICVSNAISYANGILIVITIEKYAGVQRALRAQDVG